MIFSIMLENALTDCMLLYELMLNTAECW